MASDERTFTVATDNAVIAMIQSAKRRLVVIAPALSQAVANALAARFADHLQRGCAPGRDPWHAPGRGSGAGGGARAAACRGRSARSLPERGLRGADRRGSAAADGGRCQGLGVRRSPARRHPRLPRGAARAARYIRAHFPLWGRETGGLAREMLAAGIDARIVTLDPRRLPAALCGARFDAAFLDGLPATVDPCGERGEFHTVVAYGPGFARPLDLAQGETVERGGFVYTDFRLGPRF